MIATQSQSWWPFMIVTFGLLAWTLLCIGLAARYERYDGPLSLAIIPVLAGAGVLVAVVESIW